MKHWLMCACFDMNHDVQVIGLRTGRVLSHTMAQSRTSNTLLQQHTGEVRNMTAATAAMLWHATQPLAPGGNAAEGAAALLCHVVSYAQYNCLGTQCEPLTHITRALVGAHVHACSRHVLLVKVSQRILPAITGHTAFAISTPPTLPPRFSPRSMLTRLDIVGNHASPTMLPCYCPAVTSCSLAVRCAGMLTRLAVAPQ
jgi:hypothetical protein